MSPAVIVAADAQHTSQDALKNNKHRPYLDSPIHTTQSTTLSVILNFYQQVVYSMR